MACLSRAGGLPEKAPAGGRYVCARCNVTDEASVRRAFADVVGQAGSLRGLVNNAGVHRETDSGTLATADFEDLMRTNATSVMLASREAYPHLKAAGQGAIVVVSSINGTRTFTTPGATAYSATKAAQLAMVQQLALELGKVQIRVNAICPGAIETDIGDNTRQRGTGEAGIPVVWPQGEIPISAGEPGTAEEVADAILFLASSKARHITGVPLWIDGGQGLLR